MRKIVMLLNVTAVIIASVFVSGCENKKQSYENESTIVYEGKEKVEYNIEDYIYPGKENREEIVFCCGNSELNIYSEYS